MKAAYYMVLLSVLMSIGCKAQKNPLEKADLERYSKAYFASGCFWCVEGIYQHTLGVVEAISGYAGGYISNPTYELSNTGETGHAEAVEVYYDPKIIEYSQLLEVFFSTHDIEQINGQGPDKGSQYRTIAFYQNEQERLLISNKIKQLTEAGFNVACEIQEFEKFWPAENYHQDFEARNPSHPYIQAVSKKRLQKLKNQHPDLYREDSN